MTKTAVILFNLGGPDSLESVRPFLFNLFYDPSIIGVPNPLRFLLAWLISYRRARTAVEIYNKLGGSSPLLKNTRSQALALEKELAGHGDFRVFVAMRYWHPFSSEVVRAVEAYGAERVVLMPLYPQFSTTTTASSLADWARTVKKESAYLLKSSENYACCFPTEKNFIAAHVDLIAPILESAKKKGPTRILFTAHGLPQKIVNKGDPYVFHVQKTCAAISSILQGKGWLSGTDTMISYQSRVGPIKWTGPSTESEIERAGREGLGLVLVPVSFVSEHSETLIELDVEYKSLSERAGVPFFFRVPALGVNSHFITSLKTSVLQALTKDCSWGSYNCNGALPDCPMKKMGA